MRDGFGRLITYARISVTDRCSLRCRYCMPETGGPWLDRLLTDGELLTVCRCLASLGVTRFRFTGGEPLCRENLPDLLSAVKALPGVETVLLTTNGVQLSAQLPALLDAGVDGINLSLDTLDQARFREITRRDALGAVLTGLRAALDAADRGRLHLKLNCVMASGRTGDWVELAALAKARPLAVRFIEPMPIGPGALLPACGEAEVLDALEGAYGPAVSVDESAAAGSGGGPAVSGPARYVSFSGFAGKIGFISAVSHPFCASCNRVRVTAGGLLRTCLCAPDALDLRPLLSGRSEDLRTAILEAVARKPAGHRFGEGIPAREARMNRIGG